MWDGVSTAATFCPGAHLTYLKALHLALPESISSWVVLSHANSPSFYNVFPKLENVT